MLGQGVGGTPFKHGCREAAPHAREARLSSLSSACVSRDCSRLIHRLRVLGAFRELKKDSVKELEARGLVGNQGFPRVSGFGPFLMSRWFVPDVPKDAFLMSRWFVPDVPMERSRCADRSLERPRLMGNLAYRREAYLRACGDRANRRDIRNG